jgi:hypothetical protein
MSLSFRTTNPSDGPRLAALFKNMLGMSPGSPGLDPKFMAWKYWEPRADWNEARSYVLEKEGVILAHAGIWPLTFTFQSGANPARGIQMIDWAAASDAAGAGLALLRRLVAMFDFIYSVGGSDATRRILPIFGFRPCAKAWRAARPVRPIGQILTHQTKNWKLLPRLFRNYIWSRYPIETLDHGWTAHQVSPDQFISCADPLCSARSQAFFEYLHRCPTADFTLWQIAESNVSIGFFSLALVRGQARIAGLWLRDSKQETWKTAYLLAQRTARSIKSVFEIVAGGTEGVSAEAATQAGLRVRETVPVYLFVPKSKCNFPEGFQFQLADDDEAFLDSGSYSYLT